MSVLYLMIEIRNCPKKIYGKKEIKAILLSGNDG